MTKPGLWASLHRCSVILGMCCLTASLARVPYAYATPANSKPICTQLVTCVAK